MENLYSAKTPIYFELRFKLAVNMPELAVNEKLCVPYLYPFLLRNSEQETGFTDDGDLRFYILRLNV